MSSRQKVYLTYYNKKVMDNKLTTGDWVYINLPERKRDKLVLK